MLMDDQELAAMVAQGMEDGLAENIVDMLRHDPSLWRVLPALAGDQRSRVRIGAAILIEELLAEHRALILLQLPSVAALLRHQEPAIRGDAAYLLGLMGSREALVYLGEALPAETNAAVRALMEETVSEIEAL